MDAVMVAVGLFRIAGSLPVLRWPFWGGVTAVVTDLLDLLLFDLARTGLGWPGFASVDDYQAFDKWADQAYLGTFLLVAVQDFGSGPRRVAVGLWLFRFAGVVAFEAGLLPRAGLVLVPNLFEPWFLAVALGLRTRPGLRWTAGRTAGVLAALLAAKLAQEWVLHVARAFDSTTFLDALGAVWELVSAPFR